MGQQRRRPLLEPVLENYMGPPIKVFPEPASKAAPQHPQELPSKSSSSLNPVRIFGKLRDKYVKAMNEVSMGGDLASVAGYHGCVVDPGATEQHRIARAAREKEIRAIREELAARRRLSSSLPDEEDSDDDADLGVVAAAHHHRQCKSVR